MGVDADSSIVVDVVEWAPDSLELEEVEVLVELEVVD
jgi:hypothetical protein